MYEYLKGRIVELNPAYTVLESGQIGYFIHISLNTFSKLKEGLEIQLYVQQIIKEDAHLFFGFVDKSERELFRHLILVSGIGANTARMMLSSLSPSELRQAIVSENINILKSIKGIGLKTAQRVIIELKDKLAKDEPASTLASFAKTANRDEAAAALVMLGFARNLVDKVVDKIVTDAPEAGIEDIVKIALKRL